MLEFDITICTREWKNIDNANGLSRQAWRAEKNNTPVTPGDCHVSQAKHDLSKEGCGAGPQDGDEVSAGNGTGERDKQCPQTCKETEGILGRRQKEESWEDQAAWKTTRSRNLFKYAHTGSSRTS